ncbi:uncharacterized protein METZ01_LOCUS2679, partial [marine metagenome]|jgi:hypothetical protein
VQSKTVQDWDRENPNQAMVILKNVEQMANGPIIDIP